MGLVHLLLLLLLLVGLMGLLHSPLLLLVEARHSRLLHSSRDHGHAHPELAHLSAYEIHEISVEGVHHARRLGECFELEVLGRKLSLKMTHNPDFFTKHYRHDFVDSQGNVLASEGPLDCMYRVQDEDNGINGHLVLCDNGFLGAKLFTPGKSSSETITLEPLQLPGERQEKPRRQFLVHTDGAMDLTKIPKMRGKHFPKEDLLKARARDAEGNEVVEHDTRRRRASGIVAPKFRPSKGGDGDRSGITSEVFVFTNSPMKYVGLMLANDNDRFKTWGDQIGAQTALVFAGMQAIYDNVPLTMGPYNFTLELARVITFSLAPEPYTYSRDSSGYVNGDSVLSGFMTWMGDQSYDFVDAALIITGAQWNDQDAAGWGYIGTVCAAGIYNGYQTGSVMGTYSASVIAEIASHELGHVIGSQHDDVVSPIGTCLDTTCVGTRAQCLKRPGRMESGYGDDWSNCTITWWYNQLRPGSDGYNQRGTQPACLEVSHAADAVNLEVAYCGDGIIQGDEECDCVGRDCTGLDPCCDGATCKLLPGRQCSAQDGCCVVSDSSCTTNTVKMCRPALDPTCDTAEYCDGVSKDCPPDVYAEEGTTSCLTPAVGTFGATTGLCYQGQCSSLSYQCRVEFGSGFGTPCSSTGDAACSSLRCKKVSGGSSCYYYIPDLSVGDGVSCGTGKCCFGGQCVNCPRNTTSPTFAPTHSPTLPTKSPTTSPTRSPTLHPSKSPTLAPTAFPTKSPTAKPTKVPTKSPTLKPTKSPTANPTNKPTMSPTMPTASPTHRPTLSPTNPTPRPTPAPIVPPPPPRKKKAKKKPKKKKKAKGRKGL